MKYTVDLSALDCGCVAGVYAVRVNEDCDPKDPQITDDPQCKSIDIMQANPFGFNTAAHPCKSGNCSPQSQCEYNMRVEGKAKYGNNAYGPGGTMVDTDKEFTVTTEFVSTKSYADFWMIRTTLT